MHISTNIYKKVYDLSCKYINYLKSENLLVTDDVSDFWQTVFQERNQRNYPTFNEMLNMRQGCTYGLADQASNINQDKEYQYAQAVYSDVLKTVPRSYFREIRESVIGNPICFDFGDLFNSSGYIANALTTYHIIKCCKNFRLTKQPLNILEIGAGYGSVAYQLLKKLNIKQYTICDLPENLFLSSYYLQVNFPDRNSIFVTKNKFTIKHSADFKFLIPPFLEKIPEKFDLVINSFSFQEMNLKSVKTYFDYIKQHLTDDGIFYSLNSHGKSGVINPSDYPIGNFKLLSMAPVRNAPWQYVFATTPYELVLGKKVFNDSNGDEESAEFITQFDTLAKAFQLGLQYELVELCKKMVNYKLSAVEKKWLSILNLFFQNADYQEKKNLLTNMLELKVLSNIVLYLLGILEFSYGNINQSKSCLEKAVIKMNNNQAKLRAYMLLANLNYITFSAKSADHYFQEAVAISPHLEKDIYRLIKHHANLVAEISRLIYLNPHNFWRWRNIRKKIYNIILITTTFFRSKLVH